MKIRPVITEYESPEHFLTDMLSYLKAAVRGFSISRATASLRKVSPALISLIRGGKRRVTLDRVDELSRLLRLAPGEKRIFRNMVAQVENPLKPIEAESDRRFERVGTHILTDWLNVYVKDCFHIREVQDDEKLAEQLLAHVSSPQRVERALRFLKREGFLKKTMEGKTVINNQVSITSDGLLDEKVQKFHRAALNIAKEGIKQFPPSQRHANALLIALDEEGYEELIGMIQEFSEKLIQFAGTERDADRLYQVTLNLTPTGGST